MTVVSELPVALDWQGLVRGKVEDLVERRALIAEWIADEEPRVSSLAEAVRLWESSDMVESVTAYRRAQKLLARAKRAVRIIDGELARRGE